MEHPWLLTPDITRMRPYPSLSCFLAALVWIMMNGCTAPERPSVMDRLATEVDSILVAWDSATVAVSVIDPTRGAQFHRNEHRLIHAASTMKVPVMIELFRQVNEGRLSLEDELILRNRFLSIVDGSTYSIGDDTDGEIYAMLGQPMTLRELNRRMITVSSNLATNLLIETVGADSVQATSERLGTTRMETLRGVEDLKAYERGLSNRTTSHDLAVLMDALRRGEAVSPEPDAAMLDILLAQTFTAMIPSGVPPSARVAHKTGQITRIHHDAAVVFPETGEPYVLVILIEGLADEADSSELGSSISRTVYHILRETGNEEP